MKIRTDFVTNSSSSNFSVVVTLHTPTDQISMKEDPYDYDPDNGGAAFFNADLREINDHLASVKELAAWLADSVVLEESDWNIDDDDEEGLREFEQIQKRMKKIRERERKEFINRAVLKIKSVREIDRITVERIYSAWGEFADLVADGDEMLRKLAGNFLKAKGIEKERAKAEMVTYIHSATDASGEDFGVKSAVCRYRWEEETVDELARRLVSNYGPGEVSGVERQELNLRTGEYYDESLFDLC